MKIKKGSMFRSKSNGWCYQFFVTTPDGKRKRRMICSKSQDELLERIFTLDKNLAVIKTFGDWMQIWLKNYVEPNVKPRTLSNYKNLMKYLPEALREKAMEELDTADFQALFSAMLRGSKRRKEKKSPLSTTTVRSFRSMMISAVGAAYEAGYAPKNVVKATKPPREERQEKVVLTAEEARHFIDVAKKKDYYKPYNEQDDGQKYFSDEIAVAIELALRTGMRPGEVFGLRWQCVDDKKFKIKINASLGTHSKEGRFEIGETKTSASTRTIAVEKKMIDSLNALKKRQEEYAAKLGDKFTNEEGLVFTSLWGSPVDVNNFRSRQWKALCKAADAPDGFTMHCMRHTFVTLAIRAGINIKTVSKYVGHTNVSFSMRVYAHVLDEMESEVPAALGAMLDNDENK